jgi:hypothetical protein
MVYGVQTSDVTEFVRIKYVSFTALDLLQSCQVKVSD